MSSKKTLVGIDPGLTGAFAFLRQMGNATAIEFHDMPTNDGGFIKRKGKGVRKMIDTQGVADILKNLDKDSTVVFIEKVQAFPGVAAASAFSFGKGAGIIEAVVTLMGFEWHHITPQKWKRAAGLIKQEKDKSRTVAKALFPLAAGNLRLKKHSDRAEAALIAHFGAKLKGEDS